MSRLLCASVLILISAACLAQELPPVNFKPVRELRECYKSSTNSLFGEILNIKYQKALSLSTCPQGGWSFRIYKVAFQGVHLSPIYFKNETNV